MPIRLTKFPSKQFDELFAASCKEVREYFQDAYEVAKRAAAYKAKQIAIVAAKGKRKAGKISLTKLVLQIMAEQNSSKSTVYNAIRCGEAFGQEAVEELLKLCGDSGHLPSRELFIQLLPVPPDDRISFAAQMIQEKAAARSMTLKRIETYDRKSKGTKKPKPPKSLFEAKEQSIKLWSRVNAFREAVTAARSKNRNGVKSSFAVPDELVTKLNSLDRLSSEVKKILEDAVDGGSAA